MSNVTLDEAFWSWFGSSKVVDSDGQPLVVYHGTNYAKIKTFKLKMAGKGTGDKNSEIGVFFTSSDREALMYGRYLIEAILKIENPYFATDEEIAGIDEDTISDFIEELDDGDYDGVIADVVDISNGLPTGEKWFIARSPKQIKIIK